MDRKGLNGIGKWGMVVLISLALMTAPGIAGADHGGIHGYCTDGIPTVTYWPEKYQGKDYYEPTCLGGILAVSRTDQLPGIDAVTKERPSDFGGWATVLLNGETVTNPYRDVFPYVVLSTGRTLIPIRMVTEAMGGTAHWDEAGAKVTIRLGELYMEMTIDESDAIANGVPVKLEQAPIIWKDRTMVPLRVLAEAFGSTVTWVPESLRVYVALAGVTCQPNYCVKLWE